MRGQSNLGQCTVLAENMDYDQNRSDRAEHLKSLKPIRRPTERTLGLEGILKTRERDFHQGEKYVTDRDCNFVVKYCEIVDEFIRVRIFSDEDVSELLSVKSVPNQKAFQQLVVNTCIEKYLDEVLPMFKKINKVYKPDALDELLYHICVEVNPHLEVHRHFCGFCDTLRRS